jgi:hypothetical protein
VEEAIDFLGATVLKNLDVHHLIDVMHVKKNVCESLLRTLLNTDWKIRDHGHARADLKKMGIRLELWLDDSVKGTKLTTSCITLSKHEKKELCGFLKNVKVPSGYCTEEVMEWALNYADPSNPISVPKFRHEGRPTGKGTIGKKAITSDPNLIRCAHFLVLHRCPLCPSIWVSIKRCCFETILGTMNHG